MKKVKIATVLCVMALILTTAVVSLAAYHHAGEADAPNFVAAYPNKAGMKLDSCTLCHSGGSYTSGSKTTTLGSCQWCHYKYGYNKSGDITATTNLYGKAYLAAGRNVAALKAIEALDSDGDGYTNIAEINADRFPGDANDDPKKVIAPFRVFTKAQLQAMPQHSQFMLMNTTKSGDYYAEYSGVAMQDLLSKAGITANATKITVYAPDGYSIGHPIEDSSSNAGSSYAPFLKGTYPVAVYYYDAEADKALNTAGGWCDYSSSGTTGRKHGDPIITANGLKFLLALKADGNDLVPGVIDSSNKLKSGTEGPFRTVTPQKVVGPPDQASTATNQSVKWPYDANADHNAGFSSKCATIVKVEPLPAGTTDINVLEAGWNYIDQGKIVIYGALDGPQIISPASGQTNVVVHNLNLVWGKVSDTDPAASVTYTVELSKDQTTWTPVTTAVAVASAGTGNTLFADHGSVVYWGFLGLLGFWLPIPKKGRKLLGGFLLVVSISMIISACTHSNDGQGNNMSAAVSQTLDTNTTYYWRVTADGPNSHTVSVGNFTTAQ
jgi:hypothetical protein